MATAFCGDWNIPYSESEWGKEFAILQKAYWTKYLQAGLNEMAANFKQRPTQLAKEEFEELPSSALMNLDNYPLFENYLSDDMVIEVTRAFKVQVMTQIQRNLLPADRQILLGG